MTKQAAFADRMKALRAAAGLTQAALAERSGVGASTIRQFEYGLREPTFGTLVKLAEALGVSLDAFRDAGPSSVEAKPPAKRRKK